MIILMVIIKIIKNNDNDIVAPGRESHPKRLSLLIIETCGVIGRIEAYASQDPNPRVPPPFEGKSNSPCYTCRPSLRSRFLLLRLLLFFLIYTSPHTTFSLRGIERHRS